MTAPLVAGAARAVAPKAAARAGAGKVIDVTPTSSRPLRNVRPAKGRASDVATGAGLGSLLDGLPRGSGKSGSGSASAAKRLLIAEFILCMVVLAFSPLAKRKSTDTPVSFMKRGSAIMGTFFVLGLLTTAGRGAARTAAAFGGLVTLVLLISSRSVFTVLADKLAPGVGEGDGFDQEDWTEDTGLDDAGEAVADAIGDVIDNPRIITLPPTMGIR